MSDLPMGWRWVRPGQQAVRTSDRTTVYEHEDQKQYPGYWTDHRGNVFGGGVIEACELHDKWKANEAAEYAARLVRRAGLPWWQRQLLRLAEWIARRLRG